MTDSPTWIQEMLAHLKSLSEKEQAGPSRDLFNPDWITTERIIKINNNGWWLLLWHERNYQGLCENLGNMQLSISLLMSFLWTLTWVQHSFQDPNILCKDFSKSMWKICLSCPPYSRKQFLKYIQNDLTTFPLARPFQ